MPTRTLAPKGVDCDVPHLFEEVNKTLFIRVWKPSPSIHPLRESPIRKAQRGQYLLAVDLGRYIHTL